MKDSDERYTPREIVAAVQSTHSGPWADICTHPDAPSWELFQWRASARCPERADAPCGITHDPPTDHAVWVQPPYSRGSLDRWVARARQLAATHPCVVLHIASAGPGRWAEAALGPGWPAPPIVIHRRLAYIDPAHPGRRTALAAWPMIWVLADPALMRAAIVCALRSAGWPAA